MNPITLARYSIKAFNFMAPKVKQAMDDYKANAREGDRLFQAKNYEGAAQHYAELLKEAERRHYTAASKTNILMQLTESLRRANSLEAAKRAGAALVEQARGLGEKHELFGAAMSMMSHVHEDAGEINEAVLTAREALNMARTGKVDLKLCADRSEHLARLERKAGNTAEWKKLTIESLDFFKAGYGVNHPGTGTQMAALATALQDEGQLAEALPLFEQAYAIHKERLGSLAPECLSHTERIGQIQYMQGNLDDAMRIYSQLARLKENEIGLPPAKHAQFLVDASTVHLVAGKREQAADYLIQAKLKAGRNSELHETIDTRLKKLGVVAPTAPGSRA